MYKNRKLGWESLVEATHYLAEAAREVGAKMILDEPTSALSVAETEKVLRYTLNAKERGLSVIFVSHNIHNVYQVAELSRASGKNSSGVFSTTDRPPM